MYTVFLELYRNLIQKKDGIIEILNLNLLNLYLMTGYLKKNIKIIT